MIAFRAVFLRLYLSAGLSRYLMISFYAAGLQRPTAQVLLDCFFFFLFLFFLLLSPASLCTSGCLGDHTHGLTADGDKPPRTSRPLSKQILRCSFEGCCRTFTWPAHLKYHLKTHR